MLVDWFTVIAQIVNFLILVGLLKHFLFDRITKAMDEREDTIASALQQADETRKLAQQEAERYQHMSDEFAETRRQLMEEARTEADSLRKSLFQSARSDVEQSRIAWEESLEREKDVFLVDLRRCIGEQAVIIARSALADLAACELEERIVHVFVERLRTMSNEDVVTIRDALRTSESDLAVQTAFHVSDEQRNEIVAALRNRLKEDLRVRFEASEAGVCGVELKFHGHRIGWSIDSYLDALHTTIAATLKERIRSSPQPPSELRAKTDEQREEAIIPQVEQTSRTDNGIDDHSRTGK